MRYACLIYADETREMSEEEAQVQHQEYMAFTKEVADKGVLAGGEPLEATTTATTVRVRSGETLTTDGPFAETKEQLLGFYLLDCSDLDQAIEFAARIPGAKAGCIEVRPVMQLPGMEA